MRNLGTVWNNVLCFKPQTFIIILFWFILLVLLLFFFFFLLFDFVWDQEVFSFVKLCAVDVGYGIIIGGEDRGSVIWSCSLQTTEERGKRKKVMKNVDDGSSMVIDERAEKQRVTGTQLNEVCSVYFSITVCDWILNFEQLSRLALLPSSRDKTYIISQKALKTPNSVAGAPTEPWSWLSSFRD